MKSRFFFHISTCHNFLKAAHVSYNDFYLRPVIPDLLRVVLLGEFHKIWKVNVYLHSDTKELFLSPIYGKRY